MHACWPEAAAQVRRRSLGSLLLPSCRNGFRALSSELGHCRMLSVTIVEPHVQHEKILFLQDLKKETEKARPARVSGSNPEPICFQQRGTGMCRALKQNQGEDQTQNPAFVTKDTRSPLSCPLSELTSLLGGSGDLIGN